MRTEELDLEWISLLKEAKEMGLSPDEIKLFFSDIKNENQSLVLFTEQDIACYNQKEHIHKLER
ncbi:anti-repressor SinI family protein [Alkalihalobacillus trypoxylicola]|uniref:Sin domain-containing protein n=1 Tax=Alkalihalobacillus trypoxylicola TaxID=519424 RepID=A0A162DDX7_9BACI|nr:anti-repressor SinI family protein [Alkalihalobacillus trypoxylicola]KYG29320.1 hypothetical protein AZF04_07275 [Alkalihalobacillus trypoxylicola]